jgi:hypothetical protein
MPKHAGQDEARITTVAIGFRVKSGWATAVLLAGPASAPTALDRRRVELSDPKMPMSCQPYHAGIGHAAASGAVVARLIRIVGRCAATSFDSLLRNQASAGRRVRGIGIVVGSTVDPASIANPHIRAHAAEGQLFRRVLERAARRHRLPATVVRERELYATVGQALGHPPARVRSVVALVGRHLGAPWGADEKAAAAAAWLALGRIAATERGT